MQREDSGRTLATTATTTKDQSQGSVAPSRRSFAFRFFTGLTGLVAVVVPGVAGMITFFAPLGRRAKGNLVRIAAVDDIPADGIPRRFSVVAERRDAWNRYPREPIGAVFLRRTTADGPIEAVSSVCPHLGCAVDFRTNLGRYQCPCHNSAWHADGTRINPQTSPSPRDLDELQIDVKDGQVWVNYERFKSGVSEQVPV